jgi:hypothetical protein
MLLLYFHLVSMCAAVVLVFFADKQAFAWVIGKRQTLDKTPVRTLHLLTWIALLSLMVSGFFLLWPNNLHLLEDSFFIIKLVGVGLLFVNGIVIGRLIPIALTRTFASLTWKERMPLILSGLVSSASWASILAIAYILFWPWIR